MYSPFAVPGSARQFHDRLYAGEILRINEAPAMLALVEHTRAMLEEALLPWPPTHMHRHLIHEQQAVLFAKCQGAFAGSREIQGLWRAVIESQGLEAQALACDRLHLRFQPHREADARASRARVTATIAFHRDTWGSNLYAQTNWWAPIYPITTGRTFA